MKDVLIILQARTGSTRLPLKVVRPFYEDRSVFEIIASEIKTAFACETVLATTVNPNDNVLVEQATSLGIPVYRGSEEDVLDRFVQCAAVYNKPVVVRICCDNPFLDMELLGDLLNDHLQKMPDYSSYIHSTKVPAIKTHYGIFGEVVSYTALEKASRLTNDPLYREHVTNFIYGHPQEFRLNFMPIPSALDAMDLRLTLDTQEDWDLLAELYATSVKKYGAFGWKDLVQELKDDAVALQTMQQQIKRFTK
jgi:spore coat polysaccharide biosynthesis protein SpsF